MEAEIRERWVAALRSGKYTQGFERLRTVADEYCCLGVLCDLHDPDLWHERKTVKGFVVGWEYAGAGADVSLPRQVMEWAGLGSHNPTVAGARLAAYNDGTQGGGCPLDFAEIADLIEEHL